MKIDNMVVDFMYEPITYYARKKLPDPLSFIKFIGKPA